MSAHVLLNLLNELGKREKCEACRAFYLFFATRNDWKIFRFSVIITAHLTWSCPLLSFSLAVDVRLTDALSFKTPRKASFLASVRLMMVMMMMSYLQSRDYVTMIARLKILHW